MRKKSREMDSAWALEVMRKAPYIYYCKFYYQGWNGVWSSAFACLYR